MSTPVTDRPGRGILVASGLFVALATALAPPLASDLSAQAVALEFVSQPGSAEAGQTIPPFQVRAITAGGVTDLLFSGSITLSVASETVCCRP